MARVFAKALFGLSAAAVFTVGAASAQDPFADAVLSYRLGKFDEALQKFGKIIADDPTHEAAFKWYRDTDQGVWRAMLMEQGEISKVAQHLLSLATVARKQASRDNDAINTLADQATSGDYGQRRKATLQLAADHGEFAVPALARKLSDADDNDGQTFAILALTEIGRPATPALIEALKSDNELLRRNAAAALGEIRDMRAIPALTRVASSDGQEHVRSAAMHVLKTLGAPVGVSAIDAHLAAAQRYIAGVGVRPSDRSEVVWSLQDGALVATDVPSAVYEIELAKKTAHDALAIDPGNDAAKILLAQSYLGQAAAITEAVAQNPDDATMGGLAATVPALRMTAAATGLATVRSSVTSSIEGRLVPTAIAAIHLLGDMEGRDELNASPLVAALANDDKRIAYAAALALTKASAGGTIPAAGQVVSVLANAVTEEAIMNIKVVDASPSTKVTVMNAGFGRGINATHIEDDRDALTDILQFRDVDVVVIAETQRNELPEGMIGLIRKNLPNTKILVLAADTASAGERFGDKIDGTIQGPLTSENLKSSVEAALESVPQDARRARADKVAIGASNSLSSLARNRVDVNGALANLTAQLTRADTVAIPAAGAIGFGGSMVETESLVNAISGDAASLELKVACANAVGRIFSRSGAPEANVLDPLMAVASSDADMKLRTAVVQALGKAQLSADAKVKLINTLRVNTGTGS